MEHSFDTVVAEAASKSRPRPNGSIPWTSRYGQRTAGGGAFVIFLASLLSLLFAPMVYPQAIPDCGGLCKAGVVSTFPQDYWCYGQSYGWVGSLATCQGDIGYLGCVDYQPGSSGECAEPPAGPPPGSQPQQCADPVDCGTGLFVYDNDDLAVQDVIPLRLQHAYRELDNASYAFGIGMASSYDLVMFVDNSSYSYADLILPDNGRVHYTRISSGTDYASAVFEHTSSPTGFYGSTIAWNGNGWTLVLRDGDTLVFSPGYDEVAVGDGSGFLLASIEDRNENLVNIQRGSNNFVTSITSPNGRWLSFTYDSNMPNNRVTQVQDSSGRAVSYTYDSTGRLSTFTDANGAVTTYGYDSNERLATITTPRGKVKVSNQYDSAGHVIQQTHADGGVFNFSYTLDGNGNVTTSDMTDANQVIHEFSFNSAHYAVSETWAKGKPEQETTTLNRDSSSNLLLSKTDTLGRTTAYSYDSVGNTTSVTKMSGTPQAATASFTYDPIFSQITSITDPLSHTWNVTLDSDGKATGISDPLGHQVTAAYSLEGQVTSITDPAGDTIRFGYDGADLTSISDPLGRVTTRTNDAEGRPISIADPLGNLNLIYYDAVDDVTSLVNAMGGVTSFGYDGDRNLTSVTDANNGKTTYSYDPMDRRASRTDPLNVSENYTYDGNGNVTQYVDRRGKTTVYQYDGINRRTFVGFGQNGSQYESTINNTWDGGNRLTQAVDSIAGTITRSYDGFDRVTEEQTPQGEVTYAYDASGRRTSMTVAGQSAVNYTWDNANRMTGITQGSSSVGLAYDNANRRTTLTLPNGVKVSYTYDNDSHITGLNYAMGGTQLGNLTYVYDADGRVSTKGGSLAAVTLPAAVSGNTFNAANEMTAFNGTALSYDANGNLTGDGTNTYSWDARNHLSSISGGATASFVYDAFGRRASRTVSGATTEFLYDGLNPVQELNGGNPPSPTAELLTGLDIDEYFTRTDTSGTMDFLTDTLGSTIALTNSGGSINTSYTYGPFGSVTISGQSNANPYQFTSLENDGTGLYFYRARYYSPTYQRFVAQDPIEFRGGDTNLYAYVRNRPTNLIDPRGTCGGAPSPQPPEMSNPTPQPPPPPCSITPEAYDAYVNNLFDLATVGAVVGGVAAGGLVPEGGPGSVAVGAVGGAVLFDTLYSQIFWWANCP